MTDRNLIAGLQALLLLQGEASLKDPPDGGKVRLPDAQSKPWESLGISRATWYRQRKPAGELQLWKQGSWRQKRRAKNDHQSVRSVQRRFLVFKYGIPELEQLARWNFLPPATLEQVAKWEHEDQRRFVDRLLSLAAALPGARTPNPENKNHVCQIVYDIDPRDLKRAARRAFDSTLMEMVMREAAP
jgi:hypothetical protein